MTRDDFFKFLEEKGVKEQFLNNVRREVQDVDEYLKKLFLIPPDGWIGGAFIWENSPEGEDFWRRINKEWSMYFDKTINNSLLESIERDIRKALESPDHEVPKELIKVSVKLILSNLKTLYKIGVDYKLIILLIDAICKDMKNEFDKFHKQQQANNN